MTAHRHAAVWLDHQEARIFHVDIDSSDEAVVRAPKQHVHRHPSNGAERAHPHEHDQFFGDVAGTLTDAEDILLLGPSTAKLQFMRYLRERAPKLEAKIVGVESVDHPSDPQLVAYAKRYFHVTPPRVK